MNCMKKLLLIIAVAIIAIAARNMSLHGQNLEIYSMERMDEVIENGAILSLAEIFPGDWDHVQIMNSPGLSQLNRDEAYDFCERNGEHLIIFDQFYLLVFRKSGEIVGLIQYAPGRSGPLFTENQVFKEQWVLTVPREQAFFKCTEFLNEDYPWFSSASYMLELVEE